MDLSFPLFFVGHELVSMIEFNKYFTNITSYPYDMIVEILIGLHHINLENITKIILPLIHL